MTSSTPPATPTARPAASRPLERPSMPRPAAGLPAIAVANRHRAPDARDPAVIYVGRGTPLGNPYEMGQHGDRAQVIQRYREWLGRQIRVAGRNEAYAELLRLATLAATQPVTLLCSCAPARCHAEVIRDAIHWLLDVPAPVATAPAPEQQLSLLG